MPLTLPKAERAKAISLIIVAALIIVVLIQCVIRPTIRALGKLSREIPQIKDNLKQSEALIAKRSQMENQLASLQAKLKDIKLALPPRSDLPDILQDISRLASASKVKVLKMEPVKQQIKQVEVGAPLTIYAENPIEIEAKGGYHALGEFINRIENAKNLMSIADVKVESNTNDMYNHDVKLLIVIYLLREEALSK